MAKKKKKKSRTTAGVDGGEVWCSVEIKISENYCTRGYQTGIKTPILDGETGENALSRVRELVQYHTDEESGNTLTMLGNKIEEQKDG